ncbi:MAG: DUF998 domain-containing protein [Candidatus Heimdallarchaeota archaeon]|nr:DUF998 domain-containing protein [Candidatus Heimdallarchaeota archaeon]
MSEMRAGIIAISSLICATLMVSFLRDGYNHFRQPFSELGELNTPYFIFFNFFAFVFAGIFFLYSTKTLHKHIQIEAGEILSLRIAFLGWVFTGIFPLSYSISWLYWVHIISAVIAFVFGPLGIIKISIKLSSRIQWSYFSFISTIVAFVIWGAILLGDLYFHAAIAQLLSISLFFIWYFLFLLKANKELTNHVPIN